MTEMGFDPYAEYFNTDMRIMDDVISEVRDIVLKLYELSIAVLKTTDDDFKHSAESKLQKTMSKAASMMKQLKARRKHDIVPHNAEDAKRGRESKKWKELDSAFKLLGKFGYLTVLKTASHAVKDGISAEEAA